MQVDPLQRVRVHPLVQRILRDTLSAGERAETLRNVRNLLAAASPGDPDEHGEFDRQRDIGPADLIHGDTQTFRQVVLDHSRYLFISDPLLGPDHELTLILGNQVGQDLRIAGRYGDALAFDAESVARHTRVFGASSPYTLRAKANLAVDHRLLGQFAEALALEQEIAERRSGE